LVVRPPCGRLPPGIEHGMYGLGSLAGSSTVHCPRSSSLLRAESPARSLHRLRTSGWGTRPEGPGHQEPKRLAVVGRFPASPRGSPWALPARPIRRDPVSGGRQDETCTVRCWPSTSGLPNAHGTRPTLRRRPTSGWGTRPEGPGHQEPKRLAVVGRLPASPRRSPWALPARPVVATALAGSRVERGHTVRGRPSPHDPRRGLVAQDRPCRADPPRAGGRGPKAPATRSRRGSRWWAGFPRAPEGALGHFPPPSSLVGPSPGSARNEGLTVLRRHRTRIVFDVPDADPLPSCSRGPKTRACGLGPKASTSEPKRLAVSVKAPEPPKGLTASLPT
jgi:hypothetical protein